MANRYNPHSPPRVVAYTRRLGQTSSDGSVLQLPTLTVTPLDSAAQALLSDLQANGCQQSRQQDVIDFQTQWNAAGSQPQLAAIDGLYGNDTAAALQAWVSNDAASQANGVTTAPAGCVAAAPSGASSSGTTFAPGQSSGGASSALATVQADLLGVAPWWVWALAGAAGLYGIYESSKHHPKAHPARPRRLRRHPHRRRRVGRRLRRHRRR